jgi:hypothetical protein
MVATALNRYGPYWRLNTELAAAIHAAVTEPGHRLHAQHLAGQRAHEDGAGEVVRVVETTSR